MNVSDVFQTMQATFGSSYINDFNLYGRTFRVYTQSEKDYRARPEDLAEVYVRNKQDEMIPLTALINVKPTSGPQTASTTSRPPNSWATPQRATVPGRP